VKPWMWPAAASLLGDMLLLAGLGLVVAGELNWLPVVLLVLGAPLAMVVLLVQVEGPFWKTDKA
jgi:hypothetical protein